MPLCTVLSRSRIHGFRYQLNRLIVNGTRDSCTIASTTESGSGSNVEPPFKRYRDPLSVLRALASCVVPSAETPDFRLGGDPWLGTVPNTRNFLLAKAKGRLAARLAIRDYFPNDIVAVAKEIPRIDKWLPLQTPDNVLKRVSEGELSASEGMDRLILLLAPTHAWKLYTDIAPNEPWTSEMLHRLLDLLCATNGGSGGAHNHSVLDAVNLTTLPDPDELYFAEELAIQFDKTRGHVALERLNKHASPKLSTAARIAANEAEAEAGEDVSSSSESDSDTDDEATTLTNNSQSGGRCSWLIQGPAEQLFNRAQPDLRTAAGYSSMIRGAAKFHHPQRALEFLKAATDANVGPLHTAVYSSVLRCLHTLPQSELRPQIEGILQQMVTVKGSVPLSLFEAALYCLAESVQCHSGVNQPVTNFVPFGLGLFDAIRRSGSEPSLGAMSNLLRLIHFTPLPPQKSNNYSNGYTCSFLLGSFVSELRRRFEETPPTRFDGWSTDDYTFFPMAMNIASMENNVKLAQRINNLLIGTQDRRFFLATSWHQRNYIHSYCLTQMNLVTLGTEWKRSPVQPIERVYQVYREHWGTIAITGHLIGQMIIFFQRITDLNTTHLNSIQSTGGWTERDEAVQASQLLAFRCMCQLLTDLLDHYRLTANYQLPPVVTRVITLLARDAHRDPSLSAKSSAAVFKRVAQIEEKRASAATKFNSTTNQLSLPSQARPGLPKHVVTLLVRMLFPLLCGLQSHPPSGASRRSAEVHWRTEFTQAITTLSDWVRYATKYEIPTWSWFPEALYLLWEHNRQVEFSIDDFWDSLFALGKQQFNLRDAVEVKRIERALIGLLDALEMQLTASETDIQLDASVQMKRTERRHLLTQLRHTLAEMCTAIPAADGVTRASQVNA